MHCQNALGPMLGRTFHLARERMDARMSQYDVTPAQSHALMYLQEHGGQAPQCELTAHLRVKPSTANGILDRMEEKGLLVRSVSGSDARRRLITITDKGRQQQAFCEGCFQEVEAAMVRDFTPDEAQMLRVFLGRIIQNLEEDRTL